MNTQRTFGAVLATLTGLLLGACSDDATSGTGEQTPPSESSSPGPSPAGPSTTEEDTDYALLGPSSQANLEPGRWAVTAAGTRGARLAVLDLPAGLNGGAEYIWSLGGSPENDGWIVGYWTVGGVYLDPCTRKGTFGPKLSADQFVEALASQRRTTTSEAVPVTLGGYDGEYVELAAPTGLDYRTCRNERFTIFETTEGDQQWIDSPGVVMRYWILDVDGQPVVLAGAVARGHGLPGGATQRNRRVRRVRAQIDAAAGRLRNDSGLAALQVRWPDPGPGRFAERRRDDLNLKPLDKIAGLSRAISHLGSLWETSGC